MLTNCENAAFKHAWRSRGFFTLTRLVGTSAINTDISEGVRNHPVQKVCECRNWHEPWEMMVFKKEGNQYHSGLSFKSLEDGNPGFSADKRYGTEPQAVDGCCWFYGVLICYEGFDI
jgi:hypothetical protein